MIQLNKLKQNLKKGKHVFGTWSNIASPTVTNILANTGIDFIVLDLEHGASSFETVESQIYAAEAEGVSPIVRLASGDRIDILHALEIGAVNILISQVTSVEETAGIISACKYFPKGDRGVSLFTKNHGYSDRNSKEKMEKINNETFVGILLEGEDGLNNIEEICALDNLDMIYLGIYDISQSLGIPGEVENEKVIKLLKDLGKLSKSYDVAFGSVAPNEQYLNLLIECGFTFISYRADSAILVDGYRESKNGLIKKSMALVNQMNRTLKVGIAGYGTVGKIRHKFIDQNPHMKTVAICDETFKENDHDYKGLRCFSNYKDLLDKQSLDVLFVCLPNFLAAEVTIAGLENSLHVFCEKPLEKM